MVRPGTSPPAPQQARSRRSQEQLLAAARTLMAEGGQDAVVMAEVARLAGVAVGTVYTRFGDKMGLLRAVHALEAGEMQQQALTALDALASSPGKPQDQLEGAVRAIVQMFHSHTPVMRELFRLAGADEFIRVQGAEITRPIVKAFTDLLLTSGALRGPDPELTADMCFRSVFAACAYRVTYGTESESPRPLPWDVFEDELTTMCMSYAASVDYGRSAAGQ